MMCVEPMNKLWYHVMIEDMFNSLIDCEKEDGAKSFFKYID